MRWHTHGWNRDLSWRLIHAIIPRVPRPLRPPLHLATTAICFAAMPRERRAARLNLERVTGRRGMRSRALAFRLFYNFSKFMVGYTDLAASSASMGPVGDAAPRPRGGAIEGADEAARRLGPLLDEGKGLIVITLHLGNWEAGLALLARFGRPVHVVLAPGEPEAAPFQDAARTRPGLTVVTAGAEAWSALDLLLALRQGAIVAVQGDRAYGDAAAAVPVFGAPMAIPTGPFALARASGAPIVLAVVPIRGHSACAVEVTGPLRVGAGPGAADATMREFARLVERAVARHPTQWFNFFPIWDGDGRRFSRRPSAPARAGRSCRAR